MIGLTLGNRYLLEENIGIGGMAVVYRAKDTLLNRNVAVKVLKNEFMDDDEFVKKFAMEAQSAASLSHPNIVSVYDVGSSTIEDRKYNFIVMEFIDGRTLKEVIDEEGPLDPEYISNIGVQIASGLEAAHKNGVVHRDIKPHNILITNDGVAKVTDFGIARISSSATITYTSTVLGTVHYISPEQAKGKFIDEKSDIYSLGVVLYEMATGKIPFDAENAVGIALKHIQDPLVEAKSINKTIPDGLNNIIIKSMEKNPSDRFNNATELKIALLNYRNFKLDGTNEGQTERLGVIRDEDIEERRNKAVYNMPTEEEEEEEEKKGVFKTYILPILLAVAFLGAALLIFNLFFKSNGKVEVPALVGMTYSEAKDTLEEEKLEIGIIGEEPEDLENSEVISQDIEVKKEVKEGTVVSVELKPEVEKVELPDLENWLLSDAKRKLSELDLEVGSTVDEYSDTIDKGKIIKTDPSPGEMLETKSKVTLYVSKGREKEEEVAIPNVVNKDKDEAIRLIQNSGFNYETNEEYSNSVPKGRVISQNPTSSSTATKGTTIILNISLGKEETKAPEQTTSTKIETINPSDIGLEGNYTVMVVVESGGNGKTIYNKTHKTNEGSIRLTINGNSGDQYVVYVNDTAYISGKL